MVRPTKCRMVSSLPNVTYFKPAGIPLSYLNEVHISVEEAEALKLKDLEGMEQVEGAASMGISRPTFQRVLSSARKKVADAILNGKAIRIEGGNFAVKNLKISCEKRQGCMRRMNADNKDISDRQNTDTDIKTEMLCPRIGLGRAEPK